MLDRSHAVRASATSSRYTPTLPSRPDDATLPYQRAWRCLAPHGLQVNIQMQARPHAQKAEESVVSRVHTPHCISTSAPQCKPRPLTSEDASPLPPPTRLPPTHFRLIPGTPRKLKSPSRIQHPGSVGSRWTECSKHVGHAIQGDCAKEYWPQLFALRLSQSTIPRLKTRIQQDA